MQSSSETNATAEVARLRGLLVDASSAVPPEWRLTPTEESIFRVMLAHDFATPGLITEVTSTTAKASRVHVHRIRTKLSGFKVEIETVIDRGWRLVGRDAWRATLSPKTIN